MTNGSRYTRFRGKWRGEARTLGEKVLIGPDGNYEVLFLWHAMAEGTGWEGLLAFSIERRQPGQAKEIGVIAANSPARLYELHSTYRNAGWSTQHFSWVGTYYEKIFPIPVDRGPEMR
jgi:hypothetical protein